MTPSLASVRRELMLHVAKETHLDRDEAIKLVNIVFSGIRSIAGRKTGSHQKV